ncbi:Poly(A)-specific ribonuclease [Psidium guajava]|nr:Poly(A)-specific ribonuclease [Psidium guajava]
MTVGTSCAEIKNYCLNQTVAQKEHHGHHCKDRDFAVQVNDGGGIWKSGIEKESHC